MKIIINLSPNEILKLGKLADADFAEAFSPLIHTPDDISFAIHRLINMIDKIETYEENSCDGDCNNCELCEGCDEYDEDDDGYYNNNSFYHFH